MLTPDNRTLYVCLTLIAAILIFLGRQHPTVVKPVSAVSEPSVDTLPELDGGTLLAVTQAAEIDSLKQELHDVELTSRSVGLLTLKPGRWRNGWMATFYTGQAGLNGSGTGVTKSGNPSAIDWTVAADTSILPLGTVIEVQYSNGKQQLMQVTDTGSMIKGRRLDVYVPNEHEDMRLGRQRVRIRILRMG